MKKMLLICTLAIATASSFAADDKAAAKMDPKQAEMMKAWHEASTPGEPHAVLKDLAGKWKYTSKAWMTEGGKVEESKGTSQMKMVLGGRFLQHETKGKAMGMNFEGLGMTGYNNVTKKYESSWYDNMSTSQMHGEGTYDPATKTLTDSGEFICPMKKGPVKYRTEWKIIDKNNTVFSMYTPDMETGKEFKSMEMTFKR